MNEKEQARYDFEHELGDAVRKTLTHLGNKLGEEWIKLIAKYPSVTRDNDYTYYLECIRCQFEGLIGTKEREDAFQRGLIK